MINLRDVHDKDDENASWMEVAQEEYMRSRGIHASPSTSPAKIAECVSDDEDDDEDIIFHFKGKKKTYKISKETLDSLERKQGSVKSKKGKKTPTPPAWSSGDEDDSKESTPEKSKTTGNIPPPPPPPTPVAEIQTTKRTISAEVHADAGEFDMDTGNREEDLLPYSDAMMKSTSGIGFDVVKEALGTGGGEYVVISPTTTTAPTLPITSTTPVSSSSALASTSTLSSPRSNPFTMTFKKEPGQSTLDTFLGQPPKPTIAEQRAKWKLQREERQKQGLVDDVVELSDEVDDDDDFNIPQSGTVAKEKKVHKSQESESSWFTQHGWDDHTPSGGKDEVEKQAGIHEIKKEEEQQKYIDDIDIDDIEVTSFVKGVRPDVGAASKATNCTLCRDAQSGVCPFHREQLKGQLTTEGEKPKSAFDVLQRRIAQCSLCQFAPEKTCSIHAFEMQNIVECEVALEKKIKKEKLEAKEKDKQQFLGLKSQKPSSLFRKRDDDDDDDPSGGFLSQRSGLLGKRTTQTGGQAPVQGQFVSPSQTATQDQQEADALCMDLSRRESTETMYLPDLPPPPPPQMKRERTTRQLTVRKKAANLKTLKHIHQKHRMKVMTMTKKQALMMTMTLRGVPLDDEVKKPTSLKQKV